MKKRETRTYIAGNVETNMEVKQPCASCGRTDIIVDYLDIDNHRDWYVKCTNCISVATITHATRDGAIRQWDNQWCWAEIEKLEKRAREAELKEVSTRFKQVEDQRVLQHRYEKVLDEYIKYRMLYNGTAGNINLEGRRALMAKELSAELGWPVV